MSTSETKSETTSPSPDQPEVTLPKSEAEWQTLLTPEQYHVARQKGTEPPFTGQYWNSKTPGVYRCVCCGTPLFSSQAKYDSGTGWPSFSTPLKAANLRLAEDHSSRMERTEVLCRNCGAHLGHMFADGPAPTGRRYCLNSASLRLSPSDNPEHG